MVKLTKLELERIKYKKLLQKIKYIKQYDDLLIDTLKIWKSKKEREKSIKKFNKVREILRKEHKWNRWDYN